MTCSIFHSYSKAIFDYMFFLNNTVPFVHISVAAAAAVAAVAAAIPILSPRQQQWSIYE